MSQPSRTKRSVINATAAMVSKVIVLLLGFVSRTIFLKYLSIDYLGINGLFTNILTVLSFAELGIGNAIQYHMYKPVKTGDVASAAGLLNLYRKAYWFVSVVILVVGFVLTPFIQYLVQEPSVTESVQVIFLLYIINTASSYLFIYKQTVLIADQKAAIISVANSALAIVSNTIHIIILILTRNYLLYLVSTGICTVLVNYILSCYINRKYPWTKEINPKTVTKEDKTRIIKDVRDLTISKVAGVACNGTDNIIITKMISLSAVGYASNYILITGSVNGIVNSIINSFTGSIGNLNVDGQSEHKKQVFYELMMTVYLLYSFICIGLICLSDSFVAMVWGKQYVVEIQTVIWLVMIVFQSGMNYPAYTYRVSLGQFKEMKYVYVATAVLNIGLSILFAKYWGVAGVYAATVLSKALTSEIGDAYYACRNGFSGNLSEYCLKYLYYTTCGAVTLYIALTLLSSITGGGVGAFLLKGVIAAVIIVVCDVVFFSWTQPFKQLFRRVKGGLLK